MTFSFIKAELAEDYAMLAAMAMGLEIRASVPNALAAITPSHRAQMNMYAAIFTRIRSRVLSHW
jgi:hypothetical protein